MSYSNRNPSTTASHGVHHERQTQDTHPQDNGPGESSSSTGSHGNQSRPLTSSTRTSVESSQPPSNAHGQMRHPPFQWNGVWYYFGFDGRYHEWRGVVDPQTDDEDPVSDGYETGTNHEHRQSDAYSRQANQGSAYPDSTSTETEADHGDERWYPDIQAEFIHGQEAWSVFWVTSQPGDYHLDHNTNEDVDQDQVEGQASNYPSSLELEGEDNEDTEQYPFHP